MTSPVNNEFHSIDLLYKEESAKIVESCKEIYKVFGGSFKESIVDNALTVSLQKKGLNIENQKRIDIYFEGVKVGVYIPDKVVNDKIILEIKSKPFITKED